MPVAVENEEGEKLLRDTWKLAGWGGGGGISVFIILIMVMDS